MIVLSGKLTEYGVRHGRLLIHGMFTGVQWCDIPELSTATLILLCVLDKLLLLGSTAIIRLTFGVTSVEVVAEFNIVLVLGKENIVVVLGTGGIDFLLVR